MDKETKITYSAVVLFIALLSLLAYLIQPMGVKEAAEKVSKGGSTATTTHLTKTELPTTPVSTSTQKTTMEEKQFTTATITTNKGVIEIAFTKDSPLAVNNFGTLAGKDFYTEVRFHRVIKGFMIQAGDPLSKDTANISRWGTGGPGYTFKDELKGNESYTLGTLAMANAGPNTNGSQFFIVTANPSVALPPSYTVFGHVTKGIEVAQAIENVKTGAQDRPVEDVIIEKVEVR